jgi:multimeric flavodoxin WrbA
MKALGVVGSPRKKGNSEDATRHKLKAVAAESIETELFTLAGRDIRSWVACFACEKKGDLSHR